MSVKLQRFRCACLWMMCLLLVPAAFAQVDQGDIPPTAAKMQIVTDIAGRQVKIPLNPQRIILGESRYIFALSILDREQPLKRIAGMLADFKQIDFGSYQQYREKFPEIDQIPLVGHASADSFSVEQVLTLNADLAIFGLEGHGPNARHTQLIDQLKSAGIPVIFVDFRHKPLENTVKSITLLGKVLGREQQAAEFTAYYQQQLRRVTRRLANVKTPAPKVFLHSRVGLQDLCCETMVRGMMAAFLDVARGNNIAKALVPGQAGVLNLEYLLSLQPDIYIATGIGSTKTLAVKDANIPPYIVLGAGVSEHAARSSFSRAIRKSGVSELDAVKSQRAFAIWHHFYNSPLNVVAVQAIAKWLYPEDFADLDPQLTLQTLFDRFQSVPLNGSYWVSLQKPEKSL